MIRIAYLYYDLLNLYGENGNIKILKSQLESIDVNVVVNFLTIDDELNFANYDFVYIGAGTENNQKIALKHLLKYKDDIKSYIKEGKFFLATGNSIEFFGQYILGADNKIETLDIFPYYTVISKKRKFADALFKSNSELYIGFQNQYGILKDNNYPWFTVIKGINNDNSNNEGVLYKNFYATYLIGPIFVRNPHFLKLIIKRLLIKKKLKYKELDLQLEFNAYNKFLTNFYQDIK